MLRMLDCRCALSCEQSCRCRDAQRHAWLTYLLVAPPAWAGTLKGDAVL